MGKLNQVTWQMNLFSACPRKLSSLRKIPWKWKRFKNESIDEAQQCEIGARCPCPMIFAFLVAVEGIMTTANEKYFPYNSLLLLSLFSSCLEIYLQTFNSHLVRLCFFVYLSLKSTGKKKLLINMNNSSVWKKTFSCVILCSVYVN